MKDILLKQMQFEYWANKELLATMYQSTALDERALLLFSHLISSGRIWLSRAKGEAITTTPFAERTLDVCKAQLEENNALWMEYINNAADIEFNRIVEFIFPIDNTKKRLSIYDAVFHIVHHSSYHRGQIVTKLKGTVETLPLVTYIMYASEAVAS